MLRANEVDLALLTLPYDEPGLEVVPAVEEEMVLVMHSGHPLATRREVSPTAASVA